MKTDGYSVLPRTLGCVPHCGRTQYGSIGDRTQRRGSDPTGGGPITHTRRGAVVGIVRRRGAIHRLRTGPIRPAQRDQRSQNARANTAQGWTIGHAASIDGGALTACRQLRSHHELMQRSIPDFAIDPVHRLLRNPVSRALEEQRAVPVLVQKSCRTIPTKTKDLRLIPGSELSRMTSVSTCRRRPPTRVEAAPIRSMHVR